MVDDIELEEERDKPIYQMSFNEYHALTGKDRSAFLKETFDSFVEDLENPGSPAYEMVKPYFEGETGGPFQRQQFEAERDVIDARIRDVSQQEQALEARKAELHSYEESLHVREAQIDEFLRAIEGIPELEDYSGLLEKVRGFVEMAAQSLGEEALAEGDVQERVSQDLQEVGQLQQRASGLAVRSMTADSYSTIAREHFNLQEYSLAGRYAQKAKTELRGIVAEAEARLAAEAAARAAAPSVFLDVKLDTPELAEIFMNVLRRKAEEAGVAEEAKIMRQPKKDYYVHVETRNNDVVEMVRELGELFSGEKDELFLSGGDKTRLMGLDGEVGEYFRYLEGKKKIKKKGQLNAFFGKPLEKPFRVEVTKKMRAEIDKYLSPVEEKEAVRGPTKLVYMDDWGYPATMTSAEEAKVLLPETILSAAGLKDFLESGEERDALGRTQSEAIYEYVKHVAQSAIQHGDPSTAEEAHDVFTESQRAEIIDIVVAMDKKRGVISREVREAYKILEPNGHKGDASTYQILTGLDPSVSFPMPEEMLEKETKKELDAIDEILGEGLENGETKE